MRLLQLSILIFLVTVGGPTSAFAATPPFKTLKPGQFLEIDQNLKINIVFVGYSTFRAVDENILRSRLPATSRAINRVPTAFTGLDLSGNRFSYTYNISNSTAEFDDAFFSYLGGISSQAPLNDWQDRYNQQPNRRLTIDKNYVIDSLLAERWLAENAEPMLGVDTRKYTIFFVNWFGRSDFRFHVYAPIQEHDVDTGENVGRIVYNQTISAGGTTADDPETPLGSLRRIWFFDLSAGPEFTTANWDITRADLDGDGQVDYRMPPIWEYGNQSAYRPFNSFSLDHALIARYVAIDSLFTASPIFRVSLSLPKEPSAIQVDMNLYEGNPQVNGRNFLSESAVRSKLTSLRPTNIFSTEVTQLPFDGPAKQVFDCFYLGAKCYGNRFPDNATFGGLYLYHNDHLIQYLEGDADYEIPHFAYLVTDRYADGYFGGVALSNYVDGTQTQVLNIIPDFYLRFGYGLSYNVLHEVGHHLGVSHPHDGIDWEEQISFFPTGRFFFTWAGDTSSTVMSYNGNNADFSQFDRDNMGRYLTAAYLNLSNSILAQIIASPRAGAVGPQLTSGDESASSAIAAYQEMDYQQAALRAKAAYEQIFNAASSIQIPIDKSAWPGQYRTRTNFGDAFALLNDDRRNKSGR